MNASFIDKGLALLRKGIKKAAKIKIKGLPLLLVRIIVEVIVASLLLYLLAWVIDWIVTGKAQFPALLEFIKVVTGTSFIAAMGILGAALIDNDNDGIPDKFEEGKEEQNNAERSSS